MGSGRDDVQGLSQLCCPKAMNWWPIRYSCLLLCSTVCGERWHIWLVPSSSRFSASTPPWVSLNILSLVPPPSPDPTLPEMPLSDSAVGYPGVNTFAPSPCLLHELRQSIELFWAFILSPVQWRYVRGMLGESKEIPPAECLPWPVRMAQVPLLAPQFCLPPSDQIHTVWSLSLHASIPHQTGGSLRP